MTARTPRGRAWARLSQCVLSGWFVLPLVPLALWVIARTWPYPAVLPTSWGWTGLHAAYADGVVPALTTSLVLAAATAALAVPAGALAAHALAVDPPPGARTITLLLLAPAFVPPLVVVMGLNIALLNLRVPPLAGIVVVLMVTAIPYTTLVMRAAYAGYDRAIEGEARILGATPRDVLLRVRIRMLARPLAASLFLAFLVGWSDYVVTLLVGGGDVVSAPLLVASAASGAGNDALVASLSALAVAPPLLLFVVVTAMSRTAPNRLAPPPPSQESQSPQLEPVSV